MYKSTIAALAFVLVQFGATVTMAADLKVTIENRSGYTIVAFFGSNDGTTSWEEDILGDDVLADGDSVLIDFEDDTGYCVFDFLAVFDDGDEIKHEDVDVCTVGTFTFE